MDAFLIFSLLFSVFGLFLTLRMVDFGDEMFSYENTLSFATRKGFDESDAHKIAYGCAKKVGQPGLPAWESKKRLLTKKES